jgi:hypothetical protein
MKRTTRADERKPIPIALNLDDGGPVNPRYWYDRRREHRMLVPNGFTRQFADLCAEYGVKGKYSVIPMPCCMGRLDRGLAYVSKEDLKGFLTIVRERIAPRFDITPEILTHDLAYRIEKDDFSHEMEDTWFAREANRMAAKVPYISLALRILKNAGIPATGVTSPWMTGSYREEEYAEAIGRAFWRVHRRKFSWYSLHVVGSGVTAGPSVKWQDKELGLTVVHVPWTTNDFFWRLQNAASRRTMTGRIDAAADLLLTCNGKRGRIRELADAGAPVVICTHWQSLFCDGSGAGLSCFEKVLKRIREHLDGAVQWMKCSEMARSAWKSA